MRKTQVALAALALVASSAALANGVTAYGTIDASIVNSSTGTAMGGAGNSAGTIFGFKGSEDLGGGLKAGFNLESGITAASGSTGANGGLGTAVFNRAANVSLSTESVSVTLGTQFSPYIGAMLTGATAVGGNGAFVPGILRMGGSLGVITNGQDANNNAITTGGFFINDAVGISVNGAGLTASLLHRVKASAADEQSSYSAASVSTSMAGINLALGYENKQTQASDKTTSVVLAGNTTVGGIRLNAGFGSNTDAANSNNSGYLVGASMPIAGALSGGLTYAANGKLGLGTQLTGSLQYDLGKATYAYLNYTQFSVANGGTGTGSSPAMNDHGGLSAAKSWVAVGLAHSF